MTDKKVKRVVKHPRLYLGVNGKLQRVEPGTEITVTEDQAARLGKKLINPSDKTPIDVSDAKPKPVDEKPKQ